ncbi:MAG: hypothetical protein FJX69_07175 [Alphaproteobacteria bacterium]|nr:hypothetical protein [Alphaproteobacteria bacterium]MBM3626927.1 hypothetical protein [Alphaproteobacteria bacterium]
MIRLLAEFLLPLLAPTIAYAIWRALARRAAPPGEGEPGAAPAAASWREAPWIWLGGIGILLVVAVAATLGLTRSLGDIGGGTYVAPRSVDGRIVPGHLDPPAKR